MSDPPDPPSLVTAGVLRPRPSPTVQCELGSAGRQSARHVTFLALRHCAAGVSDPPDPPYLYCRGARPAGGRAVRAGPAGGQSSGHLAPCHHQLHLGHQQRSARHRIRRIRRRQEGHRARITHRWAIGLRLPALLKVTELLPVWGGGGCLESPAWESSNSGCATGDADADAAVM